MSYSENPQITCVAAKQNIGEAKGFRFAKKNLVCRLMHVFYTQRFSPLSRDLRISPHGIIDIAGG